jgi:hypothetical protein
MPKTIKNRIGKLKRRKKMRSIGTLKVNKIVEHKDGSVTIYFSGITKFIKEIVKKIYKRWSGKLFRRMVIERLFNYCKKEYPELIKQN